jgi:hypothetical protein
MEKLMSDPNKGDRVEVVLARGPNVPGTVTEIRERDTYDEFGRVTFTVYDVDGDDGCSYSMLRQGIRFSTNPYHAGSPEPYVHPVMLEMSMVNMFAASAKPQEWAAIQSRGHEEGTYELLLKRAKELAEWMQWRAVQDDDEED